MRAIRIISALTVAFAATACTADASGSKGGEVRLESVPTPTAPVDEALPLEAFVPTEEQADSLQRAKALLINKCATRFGFTHDEQVTPDPVLTMVRAGMSKKFISVEQARQYGYHEPEESSGGTGEDLATSPADPGQPPAAKETEATATTGLQLVLDGSAAEESSVGGEKVPEGGCRGEAQAKLFEGAEVPTSKDGNQLANDGAVLNGLLGLFAEAGSRTEKDQRFQEMISGWQECMKEEGYEYKSIGDAERDERWYGRPSTTEQEKLTATADAGCRLKVNYLGIDGALDKAYQEQVVSENEEFLASIKANFEARVENAAQVLET